MSSQQIAPSAQFGLLKGHMNGLFQHVRVCDVNVGNRDIGFLVVLKLDEERLFCIPDLLTGETSM